MNRKGRQSIVLLMAVVIFSTMAIYKGSFFQFYCIHDNGHIHKELGVPHGHCTHTHFENSQDHNNRCSDSEGIIAASCCIDIPVSENVILFNFEKKDSRKHRSTCRLVAETLVLMTTDLPFRGNPYESPPEPYHPTRFDIQRC